NRCSIAITSGRASANSRTWNRSTWARSTTSTFRTCRTSRASCSTAPAARSRATAFRRSNGFCRRSRVRATAVRSQWKCSTRSTSRRIRSRWLARFAGKPSRYCGGQAWETRVVPPDILIRAENLTKKYRSGDADLVIFADLNLEVRAGERLALVGESGAGKSSLLHLLGGLDRPSSGTIYYRSKDISGLTDADLSDFRNREIGFVWQIHYLLP